MTCVWMMDRNVWIILLLKVSTTSSLISVYLIKFANSAILKINFALRWAAFGTFFSVCNDDLSHRAKSIMTMNIFSGMKLLDKFRKLASLFNEPMILYVKEGAKELRKKLLCDSKRVDQKNDIAWSRAKILKRWWYVLALTFRHFLQQWISTITCPLLLLRVIVIWFE